MICKQFQTDNEATVTVKCLEAFLPFLKYSSDTTQKPQYLKEGSVPL